MNLYWKWPSRKVIYMTSRALNLVEKGILMKNVLVYCRQGFEKGLCAQLSEVASSKAFLLVTLKWCRMAGYIVYNF